MKTTIKMTTNKSITVQPCKTGGVVMEIINQGALHVLAVQTTLQLTPDQIGALIFGLEAAEEAAQIAQQRTDATAGAAVS